jgi:hypothetical protein
MLMSVDKLIVGADILFSFWTFSYMAALEDTINLGLFGLFLLMLALCFIAFSAVTVKYSLTF